MAAFTHIWINYNKPTGYKVLCMWKHLRIKLSCSRVKVLQFTSLNVEKLYFLYKTRLYTINFVSTDVLYGIFNILGQFLIIHTFNTLPNCIFSLNRHLRLNDKGLNVFEVLDYIKTSYNKVNHKTTFQLYLLHSIKYTTPSINILDTYSFQ